MIFGILIFQVLSIPNPQLWLLSWVRWDILPQSWSGVPSPRFEGAGKNLIIGMKACQHFLMSSETIPKAAFWIEGIKLGVWLWQLGQNSSQLRFDVYKNKADSQRKSFSLIFASVRTIFVNNWMKWLYCTSSSSTILNLNPRTVIPFSWVSASCTVSSWMFRWTKCNSSGYLATVILYAMQNGMGIFLFMSST